MEQPLLVLRPSILHAIIPATLVRIAGGLALLLPLAGLAWLVSYVGVEVELTQWLLWFGFATAIIVLLPLLGRLLVLIRTKYLFFQDRVVRERSILSIERHAVPYSQICNVKTQVTVWSRLCGAGEITLITGQDQVPNLVMEYIAKPSVVEQKIHELVRAGIAATEPTTFKSEEAGGVKE